VRVLIFHGYLLSGTGSNVYNASLARALAALGHDVHLLCQDREARAHDWVDAFGDWSSGELRVERLRSRRPGGGGVTVYVPDIHGLLPVFVRDRYPGFEVRTFTEIGDAELERYIDANVRAVRDVVRAIGGADAALANHLVMGPAILARAGLRYALKVHGSDLAYAVLPELDRFRPYAEDACAGANGILVGSAHIAGRLREAVDDPATNAKVRLGPPGVDTDLFRPLPRADGPARLRETAARLRALAQVPAQAGAEAGSSWDRDPREAAAALEWLADAPGGRVAYVGKLIVSKGVDLLLAAWPLAHARAPGSRLLIVGFGAYREALERLAGALAAGRLADAAAIAERGWALEGGEERALPILSAFLREPPTGYAEACERAAGTVAFAGRLEHGEVAAALPACDALVFPSTFPEAFGMVAAEAAAAGVLPICAAHSGALEVSRALAEGLPAAHAGLVSFPVGRRAVPAIAGALGEWLALPERERAPTRAALREVVVRRWSWESVAEAVLAASAGELERLPAAD
jgi:glycosyltransferase involved in cell wall biosynthesis